jgi:hypothetical protein
MADRDSSRPQTASSKTLSSYSLSDRKSVLKKEGKKPIFEKKRLLDYQKQTTPFFASYGRELNSSLKFVGRNMVTEIIHYLYSAYKNH